MGKHSGNWDKGDQFDFQFERSKYHASKREEIRQERARQDGVRGGGEADAEPEKSDGCADKAAILAAIVGGIAWASESLIRWVA